MNNRALRRRIAWAARLKDPLLDSFDLVGRFRMHIRELLKTVAPGAAYPFAMRTTSSSSREKPAGLRAHQRSKALRFQPLELIRLLLSQPFYTTFLTRGPSPKSVEANHLYQQDT